MRTTLAALLLIASSTAATAAPCPILALVPDVVTPADAKIAPDGGILVSTKSASADEDGKLADPSNQPSWRVRVDGKLVEPVRTTLAPGLTAYRLPKGAKAATLEAGKVKLVAVTTADSAVLAAPKLDVARFVASGSGRFTSRSVVAELSAKAPAGAVGLIAYVGDAAVHWTRLTDGGDLSKITISYQGRSCTPPPAGDKTLGPGDKVSVAFVDASGRVSPRSAAVEVKP